MTSLVTNALQRPIVAKRWILVAILAWAAILRLWTPHNWLPGYQIDEAYNAWNANSLLKTGKDEWGNRLPIFAERGFDDYRSAMYVCALIPFERILGLAPTIARLPAEIASVASVLLIFLLARRMFDERIALLSAVALTISPWHITESRLAFEAALSPLLIAASIWALMWSGAPIVDDPARPGIARAIVAGLIVSISCYGYAAVRVYLPISLLVLGALHFSRARKFVRTGDGMKWCIAFAIVLLALAGPMFYRQLTDANLSARAAETRVWSAGDSPITAIGKLLARVPMQFGPLLFSTPTQSVALDPPSAFGLFHWYMLPLLLAGLIAAISRARSSASARTLLALVILYPIANVIFADSDEIHPLRCFPGIIGLCVLMALGAVAIYRWLPRRSLRIFFAAALACIALVAHMFFVVYFFKVFGNEPDRLLAHRVDVARACDWLKPHLESADAVFFSEAGMLIPHDNILIGLDYPPAKWFDDAREYETGRAPENRRHVCTRFGKIRIMYHPEDSAKELDALAANGRHEHVILILRPDESSLARGHSPVQIIGDGRSIWLLIYEFTI